MLPITPIQVPLILIPLVLIAAGNIVNLNQNILPIEVKHELTFYLIINLKINVTYVNFNFWER
jgi:hypothetical protein